MTVKIPVTELMAEKLGIITLCKHCGFRIEKVIKLTGDYWIHEDSKVLICNGDNIKKISYENVHYMSIDCRVIATPREEHRDY